MATPATKPSDLDIINEAPDASDEVSGVPIEIQQALLSIIKKFDTEDRPVRDLQLRYWKKLDYFWKGIQYIYWSEVAKDWKAIQDAYMTDPDYDPTLFAKVINYYRAHGESIISAMAAGLPYVRFFPDDADNPDDVMTAKAFGQIEELVQKHNDGQNILLKILYCLYNSSFAAVYNRHLYDKDYGTVKGAGEIQFGEGEPELSQK